MAMLETDTFNPEHEQATSPSLFDFKKTTEVDCKKTAVEAAKDVINPFILKLIDRCETLGSLPDLDEEKRMELYDARAAVRRCTSVIVDTLQQQLSKGPVKIGNTMYFVIDDPHTKTGNNNHLIMLESDANVSFMEPRGLMGDDDFRYAVHDHNVLLIEDILTASQAPK